MANIPKTLPFVFHSFLFIFFICVFHPSTFPITFTHATVSSVWGGFLLLWVERMWTDAKTLRAFSLIFGQQKDRLFLTLPFFFTDGYVGGKDVSILDWGSQQDIARFIRADNNLAMPYSGPSLVVLPLPTKLHTLPSPLPIANLVNSQLATNAHTLGTADLFVEDMQGFLGRVADRVGNEHIDGLRDAVSVAYDLLHMHRNSAAAKCANLATIENEATLVRLAYGGTYFHKLHHESTWNETYGCGHHGVDCVGKASER
jgi:hypothetical protein